LEMIPMPNGDKRLVAFSGHTPHYSDDKGQGWQMAEGFSGVSPYFSAPLMLKDYSLFLLWKPDYYEPYALYRSNDRGHSYKKLLALNDYEEAHFVLCQPHHSQLLFLARKEENGTLRLQEWVAQQEVLVNINTNKPLKLGTAPANLSGRIDSTGILHLFAYTGDEEAYSLYHSADKGKQWELVGELPHRPWEVGLYLSPSDEDVMYIGEIEAHRSIDKGRNWESINHWWEYYDDVEGALHADIMTIREFSVDSQRPFTLIGHHGGISISYDQFESQKNIGLTDLNTSQYYSVRTDPIDPGFVYAGSQDQGFQRTSGFNADPDATASFDQVISGDYGSIVFGRAGTALWTVYPGGWVNYYDQPRDGQVSASFELESEDEPVWLPPLMPNPDSGKNGIYMAGGNLDGGPGSYLIGIEYKNKKLETHQLDYNFQLESAGGALSALASTPAHSAHLYTATTNGRFFFSHDGGVNWEQSLNFIPEGHYLYGQAIYVSRFDPNVVLLAGSGYDNPAVFISRDGGKNFHPISDGLPPTLILGLAANTDESLFFAATEAGPYVFYVADQRWYDLSTPCTPVQTYWSVEYVPTTQTVRFGTYGRGIWDLQLRGDDPTPAEEPARPVARLSVYPNPATGPLQISIRDIQDDYTITLRDASGRKLWREAHGPYDQELQLDLNSFPSGLYLLTLETQGQSTSRKLIIQHR
ncbi:MAG: T9SS type A sorting domain-containing protein, partial [Lewinella sp.]|nr:T9SS type A sorting domain-containing protein [Lewinella sp.]